MQQIADVPWQWRARRLVRLASAFAGVVALAIKRRGFGDAADGVERVTHERMSKVGHVDADLVRAASGNAHLDQCAVALTVTLAPRAAFSYLNLMPCGPLSVTHRYACVWS